MKPNNTVMAQGGEGRFKPGNRAATNRGPNKVSTKVKESIVKFLEDNVDQIQDSFDELKPAQKLEFISSILPYAAPKLASSQVHAELSLQEGQSFKIGDQIIQF